MGIAPPEPTPIDPADLTRALSASLLALNNAHSVELGPLDEDRLRHLIGQAFLAARIGESDALLLALR